MTAVAADPTPTIDLSSTPRVPFGRLISVELRKMWDTKAGLWLLVSIGVVSLAIVTIYFFAAPEDNRTFIDFMGVTATPQGFLLPVLGILLVTQEWGQRTALTTFALEPSRARVVAAKVIAALVLGMIFIALAIAAAALATVVAGVDGAWVGVGPDDVGKFVLLQVSGVLLGMALGLILLNSAFAIVLSFVLPSVASVIAAIAGWSADDIAWFDLSSAQMPLFTSLNVTDTQWLQLAITSVVWIVAPFLVGLWRVMRAELK